MVSVLIIIMKLLEGTHLRRRLDQPSPIPSKLFVDCLFIKVPSDSDDEHVLRATFTRMQAKHGIRMDKLKTQYKRKHKGEMPSEGMSLLDLGFTLVARREDAAISSDGELENEESATPCTSTMEQPHDHVAAQPKHRT